MSVPRRTSIALDAETEKILQELTSGGESQSNVIRRALRLYHVFGALEKKDIDRLRVYWEMLRGGEHVVLDLDHLLILLRIAEGTKAPSEWAASHRNVAENHADQFRGMEPEQILARLEACNLFRMSESRDGFVLVFGSPEIKRFVKTFVEEILRSAKRDFELKEDLTKLRLKILS
ncbi:MAG: CopG family transcriptional regulator [Candidatus Verstraetearchaeota archaeon]|nr:CopG family transcriptional regulator [Candidatus Verstraetearchaeota archaeon]